MVDRANLEKVTRLYEELRVLDAAIGNFDAGGLIVMMTVSGGPPMTSPPTGPPSGLPRMPVTVSTAGMNYPPAMVDSIKAQFTARINAINQELTELGVTGEA